MIHSDLVELMSPGQLLQQYLLASYAYYQLNDKPMSDHAFDRLCVRLLDSFDTLQHEHKRYVNKGDLEAGTCLLKAEDYPLVVQHVAHEYLTSAVSGKLNIALRLNLQPS